MVINPVPDIGQLRLSEFVNVKWRRDITLLSLIYSALVMFLSLIIKISCRRPDHILNCDFMNLSITLSILTILFSALILFNFRTEVWIVDRMEDICMNSIKAGPLTISSQVLKASEITEVAIATKTITVRPGMYAQFIHLMLTANGKQFSMARQFHDRNYLQAEALAIAVSKSLGLT